MSYLNFPKEKRIYCKKCGKHAEHKLKEFKSGRGRTEAKGNRRHDRNIKGYRGKHQFIQPIKKQNKKPNFVAECQVCGTKTFYTLDKRMKKVTQQ